MRKFNLISNKHIQLVLKYMMLRTTHHSVDDPNSETLGFSQIIPVPL